MKIEQIYTGCLSQGTYFIESEGEIAIVDPLREVQPYLDKIAKVNGKLKYIFETHFHADFVSGHVTLSEKTNAPIIFGPNANPKYEAYIAKDYETFNLGKITITVLHTPGHTLESTCYLLKDEEGKDHSLFSGDTLFLGDVGRPDLAQKTETLSQEDLAGFLFDSLRTKIMPLANNVIVYPAHGAGSSCGKNLSKETVGTIGNEKLTNYALREDMKKEEFIAEVTDGLLPPPSYFPMNVRLNKEGYVDVASLLNKVKPYDAQTFHEFANQTNTLILDVRHQDEFEKGFIPNSIFIGLDGGFAPWVGTLITDHKQQILLVTPKDREEETIIRLSRVGYDNVIGYLEGGIESWKKNGFLIDTLKSVKVDGLEKKINTKENMVFDVRKPTEYDLGHIVNATSTPLDFINNYLHDFPIESDFYLHCASGYRSVIAASILKSRGYHNVINVLGGFASVKKTSIPISIKGCEN